MRKITGKRFLGISWSKRQTIIFVVSLSIVIGWSRFYIYASETYSDQYAISLTALLVASIAAVATLLSLKWTRDTVRPFISLIIDTIPINQVGNYIRIDFTMHNSGSLPATDIEADIDFFAIDETVTEKKPSDKYPPATKHRLTPMLLPNNDYTVQYILDLNNRDDKELWDNMKLGNNIFRLRVSYKSLDREHLTIQTEKICKQPWEKGLTCEPIQPQKWK